MKRELEGGHELEAYILCDISSKVYGKETGRKLLRQICAVAFDERGRGLGDAFGDMRDAVLPVVLGDKVYLRISHGVRCIDFMRGFMGDVHFDFILPGEPFLFSASSEGFLLAHQNCLYFCTDAKNFECVHQFEHSILRIGPSLEDGTTLILVDSGLLPIAPFAYLFRPKQAQQILFLPNIEQNLVNDCAASRDCFVCCGGGMQSQEIRFLYADGRWTTKFVHEFSPIFVAHSSHGPVSVDKSGEAFLWQNEQIIGDKHVILPPEQTRGLVTFDWERALIQVIGQDTVYSNMNLPPFVRGLCPMNSGHKLAILGDGQYYFWNEAYQCVALAWQLASSSAQAEDWLAILPTSPLSIEADPRIRTLSGF